MVAIDTRRWISAALFLAVLLGLTSIAVWPVSASHPVTVIEVPYSVCAIQLGIQESSGTIVWLPGYAYPGTPISECEDETGVLGENVLGETVMFHQFIMNGTSFKIITIVLI